MKLLYAIPSEKQKIFHKIIGKKAEDKRIISKIYFFNSLLYNFIKKVVLNNINSSTTPSFLISVRDEKKQSEIK